MVYLVIILTIQTAVAIYFQMEWMRVYKNSESLKQLHQRNIDALMVNITNYQNTNKTLRDTIKKWKEKAFNKNQEARELKRKLGMPPNGDDGAL